MRISTLKSKRRSKIWLPRMPSRLAWRMAGFEALDGQRILGADVDVALVGADGVGGDGHAFEHAVRIAFEDRCGP